MRLLATLSGSAAGAVSASSLVPLEGMERGREPPARLAPATPLEGAVSSTRRPPTGLPETRFTAFLDGIQQSFVLPHPRPTVPVVHGVVGAVIRERVGRALQTWEGGHVVDRVLYLPVALAGEAWIGPMRAAGFAVADLSAGAVADEPMHPAELIAQAREAVKQRREAVEAALAGRWCVSGKGFLYVDGGIAALGDAAYSGSVIGVVKSHRTAYVDGSSLDVVAGLRAGERTGAFLVESQRRARVASWYLRLREGDGVDPFSGTVRIEIAADGFSPAHADDVSRWVLAEREPLALPDPRWRVMAYGIRDCETYLRAVAL